MKRTTWAVTMILAGCLHATAQQQQQPTPAPVPQQVPVPSIPTPPTSTKPADKPATDQTQPADQPKTPTPRDLNQPVQPIQPIDESTPAGSTTKKPIEPADQMPPLPAETQSAAPEPLPTSLRLQSPEGPTPGVRGKNYVNASVSFAQTYTTNPNVVGFENGSGQGYVNGSLSVTRNSRNSAFAMKYDGGRSFDDYGSYPETQQHQLSLTESFGKRHWRFSFGNQTSYTPQSTFGYSFFNGVTQVSTDSSVVPSQSILTQQGDRISSGTFADLSLSPNRNNQFTLGGSFGALRVIDGNMIESNQVTGRAGYNRTLTRSTIFALSYSWNRNWFLSSDEAIQVSSVQATLSHSLGRKWKMSAGAGPDIIHFEHPLFPGAKDRIGVNAVGGLTYSTRHGALDIAMSRSTTAGSGVVAGSIATGATAGYSVTFARQWSSSVTFGFSQNSTLAEMDPLGRSGDYQAYTGGLRLSRRLTKQTAFYLSYNAIKPLNSGNVPCTVALCGVNNLTQTLSIGVSWSMRPIRLE